MKQEYDFSQAVRGKFFREGAELQLPICSDRGPNAHQRPNLFDYATSELSQDAVICWLVACAAEATGDLQKCGLEFVRTLFRAGKSDGIEGVPVLEANGESTPPYDGPCDVSRVNKPTRQYCRIDVYFQAEVDGKTVSFVIEDKKDSRDHSNQLARHLKEVINDKNNEDLIKPIYFKTGYMFSDEKESVKKNNYSLFKAEDMASFLRSQDVTQENEILHQYAEYLACQMKMRADAQANWDLNQDHVQWEFMWKLRDVMEDAASEWQPFVPNELSGFPDWTWGGLGRGTSKGTPWTQYWFAKHLFWRLDSGRKFCVENPLRLMIDRGNAGKSVKESAGMILEYRNCFDSALRKEQLCAGGNRRRAGNQCTIGSIKTANFQGMTLSEFLDRVKRVHIKFLESVSASIYS